MNEGTNDRRAGIFTEDLGFVWVKAQGARQQHSKLRAGCQDFVCGQFSLVHGKTGWRLVSARPEQNFFELVKGSSPKVQVIGNIFGLLRKLLTGEETNQDLFIILQNFLQFLVGAEESQVALAESLVLLKILHSLGFLREEPELAINISLTEADTKNLELLAPKRARIVQLINESLRAAQIL